MKLCSIGIHKPGRVKQWVVNGEVVQGKRCEHCGKLVWVKGAKPDGG